MINIDLKNKKRSKTCNHAYTIQEHLFRRLQESAIQNKISTSKMLDSILSEYYESDNQNYK